MKTTFLVTLLEAIGLLIVGVSFGATRHLNGKGTLSGGIVFTGRTPPGYAKTGYQRGRVQIRRGGKVVACNGTSPSIFRATTSAGLGGSTRRFRAPSAARQRQSSSGVASSSESRQFARTCGRGGCE